MIWFKHFTSYRNDPKVRALREEFKNDGYALPIMMVEIVAESLGATNFHPYLTYSKAVWAEFVGMDVRKFSKIVARMQDIDLFIVRVESDGKITFGTPKILEYCDEYTQNLKRKRKASPDTYPDSSPDRSHDKSPERCRVRVERSRKKKKDLTTERIETDGLDAPSEPIGESEADRQRGLATIKAMAEKIGMGDQTPSRRVVESQEQAQEQLPEIETPDALQDETIEKEQRLRDLGLTEGIITSIINAWLGLKTERFDQYALAAVLNSCGILGLDRSKIYQALEVV